MENKMELLQHEHQDLNGMDGVDWSDNTCLIEIPAPICPNTSYNER